MQHASACTDNLRDHSMNQTRAAWHAALPHFTILKSRCSVTPNKSLRRPPPMIFKTDGGLYDCKGWSVGNITSQTFGCGGHSTYDGGTLCMGL